MGTKCGVYVVFLLLSLVNIDSAVAGDRWQMIIDLEGRWKFTIGDNKKWADPAFADKDWETIDVPSSWENEGFNGYNGFAWYRKTFAGSSFENRNDNFNLFLGYIDDVDEVYFNGHKIGSSGSFPPRYHTAFNALRNYYIPKEYINFTGQNVIAVRVYDAEIEGGIVSGDVGIFVNENEKGLMLNLRGMWDFTLLHRRYQHVSPEKFNRSFNRKPPENADWVRLSVPGMWEHQGYNNYDGSAWYRKQFYVPKELQGEDLVLVLGKIDDNDETYLNGKWIGSTNQYDAMRVYHIPAEQIISGSINLILVYVDDTGGDGGIYEGPVGLMKQSEFTRFMRYRR
jgi:beta-galactosidase/beta-glucuronidase